MGDGVKCMGIIEQQRRTLLIVEDEAKNRALLKINLCDDYDILEAASAKEALELLETEHGRIAGVILDMTMPNNEGYIVLRRLKADSRYAALPVIVAATEGGDEPLAKAFKLGATECIAKPFGSDMLIMRIKNIIAYHDSIEAKAESRMLLELHKRDEQYIKELKYRTEHDHLTGLYNYFGFCNALDALLKTQSDKIYCIMRIDVSSLKLINTIWGTQRGDKLLKELASELSSPMVGAALCARTGEDDYFVCTERGKATPEVIGACLTRALESCSVTGFFKLVLGVTYAHGTAVTASELCDQAEIALSCCDRRRDDILIYELYSDKLRRGLLRNQQLTGLMHSALERGEFGFYLQPQVNQFTGELVGAEALSRWINPALGMISPQEYIPLFERNGFVEKLDRYTWDRVCAFLKEQVDMGLTPLPIAINISRVSLLGDKVIEYICSLIKEYSLTPDLLHLEITESAFDEDSERIIAAVDRLRTLGFRVEIDDFGSGYSSLNSLSQINADVLKLDYKFLNTKTCTPERGRYILSALLIMSRWLEMTLIAEGVETQQQTEFLKSIGIRFAQGYLYYRPMPPKEYLKLLVEKG